jgi:hypothetical protein
MTTIVGGWQFYIYPIVYIYIPLTLHLRRSSREISDIPPRYPHFTKITSHKKLRNYQLLIVLSLPLIIFL